MPLGAATPGGTQPLDPRAAGGQGPMQVAASYVSIDSEKVRAVAIPLYAVLSSAASAGSDQYRVPTTHDLVIEQIMGMVATTVLTDEPATPLAGSPVALPTLADRLLLKAMNCEFDLRNIDREQRIVDNHRLTLATIMNGALGTPLNFGTTPQKVFAGETLRIDLGLINADASVAGGNARYGIVLVGKLVRVARS